MSEWVRLNLCWRCVNYENNLRFSVQLHLVGVEEEKVSSGIRQEVYRWSTSFSSDTSSLCSNYLQVSLLHSWPVISRSCLAPPAEVLKVFICNVCSPCWECVRVLLTAKWSPLCCLNVLLILLLSSDYAGNVWCGSLSSLPSDIWCCSQTEGQITVKMSPSAVWICFQALFSFLPDCQTLHWRKVS